MRFLKPGIMVMTKPEEAVDLYDRAKRLFGATSTRVLMDRNHHISVNGPMSEHTMNLVRGTRKNTNEPVFVKFIMNEAVAIHQQIEKELEAAAENAEGARRRSRR